MRWRTPELEDRRVATLWAVCALTAVLFRPILAAAARLLAPCPWRAWTGWPCPGCGSTRAILRLVRADILGALAVNPLATCGVVLFIAGGLGAPLWLACGGKAPSLDIRPRPAWSALLAALFLANWAWLALAGV